MRHVAGLLLLLLLAGCGDDRVQALRAEIAQLGEERIEPAMLENARAESEAVARELDTLREAHASAQAERDAAAERMASLRERAEREAARHGVLRDAAAQEVRRSQELAAQLADVMRAVTAAQERAEWARAQAATFARELRPEDPSWATQRRLASLREFARALRLEFPDDPVVAQLAGELEGELPPLEAAAAAARLGERFARVYRLDAPAVAAPPPPAR